ncbi:MAG: hypothetical protein KGL69_07795 [Alphaproteobacteria bacterium]|nr:hypothetical protein [Alphaproteobacteria bacterium]
MRPTVRGLDLDPQTRCAHYHSRQDVIAIKMWCCGEYFACRACHDALADHPAALWPHEAWDQGAVLCGVCDSELSVRAYLAGDSTCPACGAAFNPGCKTHRHLYFNPTDPPQP